MKAGKCLLFAFINSKVMIRINFYQLLSKGKLKNEGPIYCLDTLKTKQKLDIG